MKKLLITFSGSRYDATTEAIVKNGITFGADEVRVYDDRFIIDKHLEFIRERADLFFDPKDDDCNTSKCDNGKRVFNLLKDCRYARGFGWFCWKPFVILDALERFCEPGDVVMYTDGDCYPIADLNPFFDYANEHGAMLFAAAGLSQRHWCKRDCMAGMDMDSDFWRDKPAGNARYMLFKKNGGNSEDGYPGEILLDRWLDYASQKKLTTFELSENEYPELIPNPATGRSLGQHRCEQAILTNLANWYGIPLHRPPCEDGNYWTEKK